MQTTRLRKDRRAIGALLVQPLAPLPLVICEALADSASSQAERRKLNVTMSLETNEQFAKIGYPAMRVLDDPTMASDSLSFVSADTSPSRAALFRGAERRRGCWCFSGHAVANKQAPEKLGHRWSIFVEITLYRFKSVGLEWLTQPGHEAMKSTVDARL